METHGEAIAKLANEAFAQPILRACAADAAASAAGEEKEDGDMFTMQDVEDGPVALFFHSNS